MYHDYCQNKQIELSQLRSAVANYARENDATVEVKNGRTDHYICTVNFNSRGKVPYSFDKTRSVIRAFKNALPHLGSSWHLKVRGRGGVRRLSGMCDVAYDTIMETATHADVYLYEQFKY